MNIKNCSIRLQIYYFYSIDEAVYEVILLIQSSVTHFCIKFAFYFILFALFIKNA